MKETAWTNESILTWLKYFSGQRELDVKKVKIMDISSKDRNLIPMVESCKYVMVFANPGHPELFYNMWTAGLGDCEIWMKRADEPTGPAEAKTIADYVNHEIQAPSVMLIVNARARSNYTATLNNRDFSIGSVRYVGSEIRAVIMNMLHLGSDDVACIVSGESIVVEAAMIASEGTIIAVEYDKNDQLTMEENVEKFGLNNVEIVRDTRAETMQELPVPSLAFIVATENLEADIRSLRQINPNIRIIVYTLELNILSEIPQLFKKYSIGDMEITQVSIGKLNSRGVFEVQPAPWIITGNAQ